jgi:hypothetical protein
VHHFKDLINIFQNCFTATHNTQLLKGDTDPVYLPASEERPYHALFFAHGFFSSALHECSHWLIAGEERRKQVDFGYWYAPDGRTAEEQALFQRVEVKPQAMEWILSKACGHKFRVSIDNLHGEESDTEAFKQAVHAQALHYCNNGLPERAKIFRAALCAFYETIPVLSAGDFVLTEL